MIRALLSIVLLLAMSLSALACPCTGDDSPCNCDPSCQCEDRLQADAAYGVKYVEERILELPQDQGKHYLTILGDESNPRFQEIAGWFDSNERLKGLKNQTHFNVISTDSVMYVERYAPTVPAVPCIRIQDAEGTTVFQASGLNVPMSPDALSNAISTQCLRNLRNRRKPAPAPAPAPGPKDDPAPQPLTPPDVQPDVQPDVRATSEWPAPLALAGCVFAGIVIGGGLGVVKEYKKTHLAE